MHRCVEDLAQLLASYVLVDVILGQGDNREVVQPDILFIAAARNDIIKLHAPDLAVEILLAGTAERDRGYETRARWRSTDSDQTDTLRLCLMARTILPPPICSPVSRSRFERCSEAKLRSAVLYFL